MRQVLASKPRTERVAAGPRSSAVESSQSAGDGEMLSQDQPWLGSSHSFEGLAAPSGQQALDKWIMGSRMRK